MYSVNSEGSEETFLKLINCEKRSISCSVQWCAQQISSNPGNAQISVLFCSTLAAILLWIHGTGDQMITSKTTFLLCLAGKAVVNYENFHWCVNHLVKFCSVHLTCVMEHMYMMEQTSASKQHLVIREKIHFTQLCFMFIKMSHIYKTKHLGLQWTIYIYFFLANDEDISPKYETMFVANLNHINSAQHKHSLKQLDMNTSLWYIIMMAGEDWIVIY